LEERRRRRRRRSISVATTAMIGDVTYAAGNESESRQRARGSERA